MIKHRKSPQWGQSQPCIVVLAGLPLFLALGLWRRSRAAVILGLLVLAAATMVAARPVAAVAAGTTLNVGWEYSFYDRATPPLQVYGIAWQVGYVNTQPILAGNTNEDENVMLISAQKAANGHEYYMIQPVEQAGYCLQQEGTDGMAVASCNVNHTAEWWRISPSQQLCSLYDGYQMQIDNWDEFTVVNVANEVPYDTWDVVVVAS